MEKLQNSIPAKEIELENKVKEIAESWVKEFNLEGQKRLAKQGENIDLNALKNEVEERIEDNLINLIDKTLSNKEQYQNIKSNLKELGIRDSSSRIYEVLKEMIIDDKKFF